MKGTLQLASVSKLGKLAMCRTSPKHTNTKAPHTSPKTLYHDPKFKATIYIIIYTVMY